MKITPDFLKALQDAGWNVILVDEDHALGACPRAGCGLQVKLQPGKPVPKTCRPNPALAEVMVESFDDARIAMRDRREQLHLSIPDVEQAAGLATDHLAKFERDNAMVGPNARLPNAQAFIEWCNTLGYTVVLRPTGLPIQTLRIISENRHQIPHKKISFSYHRRRRAEKAAR